MRQGVQRRGQHLVMSGRQQEFNAKPLVELAPERLDEGFCS